MKEYISENLESTAAIASELADSLKGGELIALSGNLGAGKTIFVKSLAKFLGVKEEITSPTFVLMKIYTARVRDIRQLVHVDCYRLEAQNDLSDIGLEEYLDDPTSVMVIEWADKIAQLPQNTITIKIDYLTDTKRKITIDR